MYTDDDDYVTLVDLIHEEKMKRMRQKQKARRAAQMQKLRLASLRKNRRVPEYAVSYDAAKMVSMRQKKSMMKQAIKKRAQRQI